MSTNKDDIHPIQSHQPTSKEREGYDLVAHLHRQKRFSVDTFGPGDRLLGVLDHIRRELKEIESNPEDLSEWIDLVLLSFDGAWRRGFTPEQIAKALAEKQSKNEKRKWPDWRTQAKDKAIEHIKSEPTSKENLTGEQGVDDYKKRYHQAQEDVWKLESEITSLKEQLASAGAVRWTDMHMYAAFEQGWDNSYREHLNKPGSKSLNIDFEKLKESIFLKPQPPISK